MNIHIDNQPHFLNHYAPFIIVLIGVLIGSYSYLYLTTVESNIKHSLSTGPSSSAIIVTPTVEEEEEETVPAIDKDLQKIIKYHAKKQSSTMGVLVHNLENGQTAGVNQTTTFKAASIYKLFVAYETLLRVDEGSLKLTQATGYDTGSKNIGDCLEIMITVSDNPCGRALRQILDVTEKPDPRLAKLGFIGTNLAYDYPTTSPIDIGLLFEKLYNQTDLSEKSNKLLLTHLKNQRINDRIPQGLTKGTEVAHKTGDLEGFMHDAGIVYHQSGDYILVIMGGPWNSNLSTVYGNYSSLTSKIDQHLGDAQ